jgi:hypothetical protein
MIDSTSGTGNLIGEYNGLAQEFTHGSSGICSEYCGIYTSLTVNAGVVSNSFAMKMFGPDIEGGTVTNSYGLYLYEMNVAGATNAYQIRSLGVSPSLFNGTIQIEPPAATTALQLTAASAQTADLAQFLVSGNTTPVSRINNVGQFVLATTSGAPTNTPTLGACAFDPATNRLYIYGSAGWKSTVLS